MLLVDVKKCRIPPGGYNYYPNCHAVNTKVANAINALIEQPVYKKQSESEAGFYRQPEPALEPSAGQDGYANGYNGGKPGQAKERIRKAEGMPLAAADYVAASQYRIEAAAQRAVGVFEQPDFILAERKGAKHAD